MPTSVTIVGADGKIWTTTTFTEVTPHMGGTSPQSETIDLKAGEEVEVKADPTVV